MQETWVQSLGREDPLEKEMATHSSILAWRIPWAVEPGGLQSMGSQRVGHDWATSLSLSVVSPKSREDTVLQDGGSSPCCWTMLRVKRCEDWIGLHETHWCNLNRRELSAEEMDPNWDGVKRQKGDARMEVRLQTTNSRLLLWIGYRAEKAMAPYSSTLAWKIPLMEELGRLQSMGSKRVRHDRATSLSLFTFMHWRRKWQPLQCSCLENPRDGGAWWAAAYGVAQSRTRLKRLSNSSSSSKVQRIRVVFGVKEGFCDRWWWDLFLFILELYFIYRKLLHRKEQKNYRIKVLNKME